MVIKVYISGLSGNKEVKKHQQRALLILDSHKVDYEVIDITEPEKETNKEFIQQNCKHRNDSKMPLLPQFFKGDEYCGDYEDFDSAVEVNSVLCFLKLKDEEELALGRNVNGKEKNGAEHKEVEEGKENEA